MARLANPQFRRQPRNGSEPHEAPEGLPAHDSGYSFISPWWVPALVGAIIVVAYLSAEYGIPPWPTGERPKRDDVYRKTVALVGDQYGEAYLPLGALWKSGGQELSERGIRDVCNRLAKIGLPPFPMTIAKYEWPLFLHKARDDGRSLEKPRDISVAFDEWQKDRTLEPGWESIDPDPSFVPGLVLTVLHFDYEKDNNELRMSLMFRNNGTSQRTIISVQIIYRADKSEKGVQILSSSPHDAPFLGKIDPISLPQGEEKHFALKTSLKEQFFFKVGSQTGVIVNFTMKSGRTASKQFFLREVVPSHLAVGYSLTFPHVEGEPLDS